MPGPSDYSPEMKELMTKARDALGPREPEARAIPLITKFENDLIELIYAYMGGGLSGADVRTVLLARVDDDFDSGHRELFTAPTPSQQDFLNQIACSGDYDPAAVVGGPPKRMCEACERGDHFNCGMQTWCECDCDGPDSIELAPQSTASREGT